MTPPRNLTEENKRLKREVKAIKELRDTTMGPGGYCQLMHIASALWRDELRQYGNNSDHALVPAHILFMSEEHKIMQRLENSNFDEIIETALK